ncbi:uncharacterized protein BCR38DRAFT_10350 [Pseudomassariella vexata]|uniref:Mid2 domain-containing protein n=1 Tax=Pseudomassariella vexata TaxID=1141098 RepID=A0A1Y2EIN6_9PEZI|nr:uncharacterized protein BCR38DRAFT_10350 [Pseudomassariella vexata]ORY71438.1 hypothetical protein BCR38DRAFT_10350 [Pseudomassariella vexata]
MRSTIFLLAAASGVSAKWIRRSGERARLWTPQETGYVAEEDQALGWTPKPTPAPGVKSEGEHVLDLLRRETTSTWTNSETCGWVSGISSYPWTCAVNSTCATNFDNVVACSSGTYAPFFSVCFDYAAYQGSQCSSIGSLTGCCNLSQYPACGTYIWTGQPPRSMFRCFSEATIISMLDEPQFVIDASLSSKTMSTTKTGTTDGAVTATDNVATAIPGQGSTTTSNPSSSASNTGAIVGGVVGGVGGLALIAGLIAFLVLRNKKKKREAQSYNTVPANDQNEPQHPGVATPAMSYMNPGETTYPPPLQYGGQPPNQNLRQSMIKPYDPNTPQQQQYDPNAHVYYGYNNNAAPGQSSLNDSNALYHGARSTRTGSSPPHSPGQSGYQYPQLTGSSVGYEGQQNTAPVTELDGDAPAGYHSNPIEMASAPQRY